MADRLTVPLEWRGHDLWIGRVWGGWVEPRFRDDEKTTWYGWVGIGGGRPGRLINRDFPTRSAAMRAVEDAVRRALGAEGGGDE